MPPHQRHPEGYCKCQRDQTTSGTSFVLTPVNSCRHVALVTGRVLTTQRRHFDTSFTDGGGWGVLLTLTETPSKSDNARILCQHGRASLLAGEFR